MEWRRKLGVKNVQGGDGTDTDGLRRDAPVLYLLYPVPRIGEMFAHAFHVENCWSEAIGSQKWLVFICFSTND